MIIVRDTQVSIVQAGQVGPPGPPGEEEVYASIVDFVDDATAYRGEAAPGSATSAAVWRIRKLTFGPGDDVTITWADGNSSFDNVWDNRAALTYT
jgi:hypothetical protein